MFIHIFKRSENWQSTKLLDYQEFMMILNCILKLVTPIIDNFNIEQFGWGDLLCSALSQA